MLNFVFVQLMFFSVSLIAFSEMSEPLRFVYFWRDASERSVPEPQNGSRMVAFLFCAARLMRIWANLGGSMPEWSSRAGRP